MFDWFTWTMNLVSGLVVAVAGGIVLLIFVFPRMSKTITSRTISELKKDPQIKPMLDKAQELTEKLTPLAEQFKKLDLDKIQGEFQPLIDSLKRIDPKDIDAIVANLKVLTNSLAQTFAAPPKEKKIPKPA